jgi:cohesin complex subunit SA-1/2
MNADAPLQMIDHALQLLSLHIVWKVRGLPAGPDPSAEEVRFRETLLEQRDSLLEKLIEFAVGTQSNTAEGVKRAVSILSLFIYLLSNVESSSFVFPGIPKPHDPPHSILPNANHRSRW